MKHLRIFAIVVTAILMVSCNKNDDQATGVGDVVIVAKQTGTSTVYGISLYAYSLSPFESVSAASVADASKTYTLKANQGYKTSFLYETPDNEFTATKPQASIFNFAAIFENGVTQEFQNTLSDKVLSVATIEKCEYNETDHQLDVEWALVDNANNYALNILEGSKFVFGSTALLDTRETYSIKASGNGWVSDFTPVSGKTYTVRLIAILYEPGGDAYNIQATSIAEKTVVWGN